MNQKRFELPHEDEDEELLRVVREIHAEISLVNGRYRFLTSSSSKLNSSCSLNSRFTLTMEPKGQKSVHERPEDRRKESSPVVSYGKVHRRNLNAEEHACHVS